MRDGAVRERNGVRLGMRVRDLDGRDLGGSPTLRRGHRRREGVPFLFRSEAAIRYDEVRGVRDGALVVARSARLLPELAAGEMPAAWRVPVPPASRARPRRPRRGRCSRTFSSARRGETLVPSAPVSKRRSRRRRARVRRLRRRVDPRRGAAGRASVAAPPAARAAIVRAHERAGPRAACPAAPAAYRWLVLLACSVAMFGNYYASTRSTRSRRCSRRRSGLRASRSGSSTPPTTSRRCSLLAGGVSSTCWHRRDRRCSSRRLARPASCSSPSARSSSAGARAPMAAGGSCSASARALIVAAATTVVGRWFRGRTFSFALAIELLIARFGSLAADQSPDFARSLFDPGWQPPLLLAAGLGVFWLVFAIVYAGLEANATRAYGMRAGATDKLVLGDLVRFERAYWWVVGLCVAFYATIFPFRTFANLFLIDYRGLTERRRRQPEERAPAPLDDRHADLRARSRTSSGSARFMMAAGSALLVPPFLLMLYRHLAARALHGDDRPRVRARARGALAGGHLPRPRAAAGLRPTRS